MVENLGNQKLELLEKTTAFFTAMWVGLECQHLSVAATKGGRGHRRDPNCQFRPWTVRDGICIGWLLRVG